MYKIGDKLKLIKHPYMDIDVMYQIYTLYKTYKIILIQNTNMGVIYHITDDTTIDIIKQLKLDGDLSPVEKHIIIKSACAIWNEKSFSECFSGIKYQRLEKLKNIMNIDDE